MFEYTKSAVIKGIFTGDTDAFNNVSHFLSSYSSVLFLKLFFKPVLFFPHNYKLVIQDFDTSMKP